MDKVIWPSLEKQLKTSQVFHGSQLEKFIQENQDFNLLRLEEVDDKIGLPPWLRVHWRKNHPEGKYSKSDPTGGYPRVLKNVYTWMLNHQDNLFHQSNDVVHPGTPSDLPANESKGSEIKGRKHDR